MRPLQYISPTTQVATDVARVNVQAEQPAVGSRSVAAFEKLKQVATAILPGSGLQQGGSPPTRTPPLSPQMSSPSLPFVVASAAYGNKAANLLELQHLAIHVAGVEVPDFLAISHANVEAHVRRYASGIELDKTWAQFVAAQGNASYVTSEAAQILHTLRENIESLFIEQPLTKSVAWLSRHQDAQIMVRSTGHEDSETLENAGGNDSIPNVAPRVGDVSAAIGRVISSYFSEKSLAQRLQAGDDICAPPFLPVLLQVMVAEKANGQIPVSGVMYTREPSGPTHGTAMTTAAWGHNHGVVTNTVQADTVYLGGKNQSRHDVTQRKDERVAPTAAGEDGGLKRVVNPKALRQQRAFLPKIENRLLAVRALLEDHFGRPMDIEWTYNPGTDVLSLLQARPLTAREGKPSYLRLSTLPDLLRASATPIVGAGGRVRIATEPVHIITANTIQEALDMYCLQANRHAIKAVLIAQSALPTSHEAATFRRAMLPVLQVHEDISMIRHWIDAGVVCIDTQLGAIVAMERAKLGASECTPARVRAYLRQAGALQEGFVRHPVAAQQSLLRQVTWEQQKHVEVFLRGLLTDITTNEHLATTDLAGLLQLVANIELPAAWLQTLASTPGNRLDGALEQLASSQPEIRTWALLHLLQMTLKSARSVAHLPGLRENAVRIVWQTLIDAREFSEAHIQGTKTMDKLLAITWLRATATQNAGRDIVDAHSLTMLLGEVLERRNVGVEGGTGEAQQRHVAYARLSNLALGTQVRDAWDTFTRQMRRGASDDMNGILVTMLHTLADNNIAGWWLNTSFFTTWSQCAARHETHSAIPCLKSLIAEMCAPETQAALAWSRSIKATVGLWRGRVSEWGEVRNFDSLWQDFSKSFGTEDMHTRAHTLFAQAKPLGRFIVLSCVEAWLDVHDASIKALIGSPNYSHLPRWRAERWLCMLQPFNRTMRDWVTEADPDKIYAPGLRAIAKLETSLAADIAAPTTSEAQFEDLMLPSATFSVDAATFGDETTAYHCSPKTLHDLFSLSHQNTLSALAILQQREHPDVVKLQPEIVRTVSKAFTDIRSRHGLVRQAQLQSVDVAYPMVTFDYVMALRQHSARFQLSYDNSQTDVKHVRLGIQLCGKTEKQHRMERIMLYVALASHVQNIAFVRGHVPLYHRDIMSFTWDLDLRTPSVQRFMKDLEHHIANIAEMTFIFANGYRAIDGDELGEIMTFAKAASGATNADFATLPQATLTSYPWFNHRIIETLDKPTDKLRVALATCAAGSMADRVDPQATQSVIKHVGAQLKTPEGAAAWGMLTDEQRTLLLRAATQHGMSDAFKT